MTVRQLIETGHFRIVCEGAQTDREIGGVFCCDLLSIAMAKGIPDAAWVSVMGNANAIAVLTLTDMSCLILAEGANADEACLKRAETEGVTVLSSDDHVFDCALRVHEFIS